MFERQKWDLDCENIGYIDGICKALTILVEVTIHSFNRYFLIA